MAQTVNSVDRDVAHSLWVSIGLLLRRLRQVQVVEGLTMPEWSALVLLEQNGPQTPSELARLEQIRPQSMGTTVSALEARGLLKRRADPNDGRRSVLSITPAGARLLSDRRGARIEMLVKALGAEFSEAERARLLAAAPLIERLARSIEIPII